MYSFCSDGYRVLEYHKISIRLIGEFFKKCLQKTEKRLVFLGDLLRKNFCLVDQQYPIIPSQGMNPTTLQIISKRRFSSDKENPICNLSESGPNHLLSQPWCIRMRNIHIAINVHMVARKSHSSVFSLLFISSMMSPVPVRAGPQKDERWKTNLLVKSGCCPWVIYQLNTGSKRNNSLL